MDKQSTFAFEDCDQESSPRSEYEIGDGMKEATARDGTDDRVGTGEEQESDETEASVQNQQSQGSKELGGKAAATGQHVVTAETTSIYESPGLVGPFDLGPLTAYLPDPAEEDIIALATNIKANGLLDEPTVAGSPPQVVDGKRRILACEAAGVQPTYRLLRGDVDPKVYLWARNGERRNLTPSQKAFYFAELFPSSGPGRPPSRGENCPMSDNFPQPTQGQGAKEMGISRHLVHGASKIVAAIKNGRLVPEAGEAIKKDIATVSDVVKDNVMDAPMEVQLEALSLVKGGTVRTMAAAVERVKQETLERMDEPGSMSSLPLKNPSFPPPLRIGKRAAFHQCSVGELKARVKPRSVNLILVHPPDGAPIEFFFEIGALASHALKENGVLVAAVVANGNLPERLTSL